MRELLAAIAADPPDVETRRVYADALEDRGELARAEFVRLHLVARELDPDDVRFPDVERELGRLRAAVAAPGWLDVVEPERARLATPECSCFEVIELDEDDWVFAREPVLHRETQDTACEPWQRLLAAIDEAAATGATRFSPFVRWTHDERAQIVTLPPAIAKLTEVTELMLNGANLCRLPPEIGALTELRQLHAYKCYRLHWVPYELTRCTKLRDSTVSTRALYGNFKHRYPFPSLHPAGNPTRSVRPCSVCGREFVDERRHRVWLSHWIAPNVDVLPMLVNACSAACVNALPVGAENHLEAPHRGGLGLVQPPGR